MERTIRANCNLLFFFLLLLQTSIMQFFDLIHIEGAKYAIKSYHGKYLTVVGLMEGLSFSSGSICMESTFLVRFAKP